jgi:hypothetical protein
MRVAEVILHTRHLADQTVFCHRTLGLPLLAETANSCTLQAGTTRLRFQETASEVLYHLAFALPCQTFQAAKACPCWPSRGPPRCTPQHPRSGRGTRRARMKSSFPSSRRVRSTAVTPPTIS